MSNSKIRDAAPRVNGGIPGLADSIAWHVLANRLGMIPDPEGGEAWLSVDAIAHVMGREPKTLRNYLSRRRGAGVPLPDRHPAGDYYRMSEFVRVMFDGQTPGER